MTHPIENKMDNMTKRLADLTAKITRLKNYREELNDTNEDTLSIDQIIDQLECQVFSIQHNQGDKK